ncbi:hypothetical protein LNTAR_18665 [Lentisphaera araneosa HTCC2155]|jgi:hypothetical protein|uniref:Uncharacterized protein n=1 Tax=Lentisphaera araneosa HTCC2155 TaxID=313628 RepID=A6DNN9_9BACT|nr:hypothetical protein [Lentisphaera araneosa]EDM26698.1 hypothetical protein LNTAR_18665 [Lentisphaera araneosa HTCC2155]
MLYADLIKGNFISFQNHPYPKNRDKRQFYFFSKSPVPQKPPFPYDLSQFNKLNRLFAFEIKQLRLLLPVGFNSKLLFEMIRQLKSLNYAGKMIFSADEPKMSQIEYLIEEVENLYKH